MSTLIGTQSHQSSVKGFIERYPVLVLYILMFSIAWSVMVPQALYSQGILAKPVPAFLEIATGWAPAIAAILTSVAVAGRPGVRELLSRLRLWHVGLRWYLIGGLLFAFLILGGIGLHVLSGGTMPIIPAADAPIWQIPFLFLLLVLVGVLVNTEEFAWRGFALPRLQSHFGPLIAAALIGIPESLFHLPLFWVKENPFFQTVGLYWYTGFSLAAVVIYIFVFNKTQGSLLIVTLLHASQNAWANLLSDNSARPFQFTVILMCAIALVVIVITRGRLGYQNPESSAPSAHN